jgi:Tfp pilus assembly protein PilN
VATAQGVSSINLLPKDSFEFSALGKALKWATTVGRVLVVLTEFVVLLAFGSRFYFDKKLDDLNTEITQKQAQITAYAQVETDMRKVLAKQQPIEALQTGGLGFQSKIEGLTQILPAGTTLDTLSLSDSVLAISGKALSEGGFAQFLDGVKKLPGVNNVDLSNTSFDQTSGGVKFTLQITFNNG